MCSCARSSRKAYDEAMNQIRAGACTSNFSMYLMSQLLLFAMCSCSCCDCLINQSAVLCCHKSVLPCLIISQSLRQSDKSHPERESPRQNQDASPHAGMPASDNGEKAMNATSDRTWEFQFGMRLTRGQWRDVAAKGAMSSTASERNSQVYWKQWTRGME